jgi:uncharacterized protein
VNKIIFDKIVTRLSEIELEHKVEILYAIESGSRAWGFESTDSDYDVRFIYKNDVKWYLSVLPQRDVIEYPIIDEFDYSGWDLKKTLYLLNKSNPVLFEWLKSPIIYKINNNVYDIMKKASDQYFSPIGSIYHYLHMAKGNYREFMQNDKVKIKKYFYILRPLLACLWIARYNQSPPIVFEELLEDANLNNELLNKINILLQRKKAAVELGLEDKIPEINLFIDNCIEIFEDSTKNYNVNEKPSAEYLNNIFNDLLGV